MKVCPFLLRFHYRNVIDILRVGNMYSESLKKAQIKYQKNNTYRFLLALNRNTDKDIIEKLESVENRQGYLKALVRLDIEKSKGEKRE